MNRYAREPDEIVDDGKWDEFPSALEPLPVTGSEEVDGPFVVTPLGVAALKVLDLTQNFFEIGGNCDSPIEEQLGAYIIQYFETNGHPLKLCKMLDLREATSELVLVPQYAWSIYRTDWAILRTNNHKRALLIECDGKDFHSSIQQLRHDKKKDQAAHDYGHLTVRFTGSQIWRRPKWCASQIYQAVYG